MLTTARRRPVLGMPPPPAATPCLPETGPAMTAPLAKSAFAGIEAVAHLAAGGETPALVSHQAALARFLADKSGSMPGRERMFATVATLKADLGRLLGVPAADI